MTNRKTSFSSGTKWEEMAAYSRAVRVGDNIWVSGTTATGPDGLVGGDDPAAQARFIFEKIEFSIRMLGGRFEDIVRTRVFVSDIANWEAVARVHGERFKSIRPVG
jgi:enamine deaminase RidA (YjgF/YER057c/UK114 family)